MRTIVVTGASAGIGLESALQLGADGHHLVLVGRHEVRLADAAEAVRAAGASRVETFVADFASLDSVRTLARDLLERLERIDVLVSNAGTVFARRTVTDDGLEATFEVNHLAGLPADRAAQEAAALLGAVAGGDHVLRRALQRHPRPRRRRVRARLLDHAGLLPLQARQRACTRGRSRPSCSGTGVTVNAVHPGSVATDIWSGAPWFARPFLAVAKRRMLIPRRGRPGAHPPRRLARRRGRHGGVLRPLPPRAPSPPRPGRRPRPPPPRGVRPPGRPPP